MIMPAPSSSLIFAITLAVACFPSMLFGKVRVATYNLSLNRNNNGTLYNELLAASSSNTTQIAVVTRIIQINNPDILLINEFDYDPRNAELYRTNFLQKSFNGSTPVTYPYMYIAPSNTGIPTGFDLDNNGMVSGGNDAFGFGNFPGHFGMVVYSKYPLVTANIRTFQLFKWKDMPNNLIPTPWYSPEEVDILRLSSKSHWDIPILVDGQVLHFLVSHPTPPTFDGPEDRNGRRNFDEIRFWADYINGASYIYDDNNQFGGLPAGRSFVIAGDQNSDPNDGDSIKGAAQQLLNHPLINNSTTPTSLGGVQQNTLQGGANVNHTGNPAFDTADFNDNPPGNLRVDYVLPSKDLFIESSAVFWPLQDDQLWPLVGNFPFPSSDHKLVYIDIALPDVPSQSPSAAPKKVPAPTPVTVPVPVPVPVAPVAPVTPPVPAAPVVTPPVPTAPVVTPPVPVAPVVTPPVPTAPVVTPPVPVAPVVTPPVPTAPVKAPTKAPVKAPTKAPVKAPTKAPVKTNTTAPVVVPTEAPVREPCGLLNLSILCFNGCGIFGRIIGLCN